MTAGQWVQVATSHTWVCLAGRAAPGTGKGRQPCTRSSRSPWLDQASAAHVSAGIRPGAAAPELGELLEGYSGRLGASGETVQGLESCWSTGEHHGLPGALPGSGVQVWEGWAAGPEVSTPTLLVQTQINSANQ